MKRIIFFLTTFCVALIYSCSVPSPDNNDPNPCNHEATPASASHLALSPDNSEWYPCNYKDVTTPVPFGSNTPNTIVTTPTSPIDFYADSRNSNTAVEYDRNTLAIPIDFYADSRSSNMAVEYDRNTLAIPIDFYADYRS